MSLGWLAALGAFLLIAGLATLFYDGFRRKSSKNPFPFPDDATNRLEDTAVQVARPARTGRWAVGGGRWRNQIMGTARRPVNLAHHVLLAAPRRLVIVIIVCSAALTGLSLVVLAAGSGAPSAPPGTLVIAIAPFGKGNAASEAQGKLVAYVAQSITAAAPGPVHIQSVSTPLADSSAAESLRAKVRADVLLWGELGADGTLTAAISLSPDFSAGRPDWLTLGDPDINALVLPGQTTILFPPGASTDPLVPLVTALAEYCFGSYAPAADAAWGAQETLNQAGALGQFARLLEAEARLASGDYAGSVKTLSVLAQSEPLPDEGLVARAIAVLNANDYAGAAGDCDQVIGDRNATDHLLAIAYLVRARSRAGQQDFADALADLDESGRLDPQNMRVRLERATDLYQEARPSEAAAELGAVLQAEPAAAPAYRLMGLVRMMQGQPQDALSYLDRAYGLYQGWLGELRAEEGQASATGDSVRSHAATDGIIRLNARLADVALYEGMAWGDVAAHEPKESFLSGLWRGIRGEPSTWEKALSKLQEAQRLDPRRPDIPLQLGSLYAQQGDYANATTALQQARDLDPTAPEPYVSLARVQVAQGQPKAAIDTLNGLLASSPGYYPAYDQMNTLYTGMNDTASAQSTLERAVAVAPQTPSDHLWRGKFLKTLGRLDQAEAELRIAGQDPQLWEAHLQLGQLLLAANRGPEALTEFQTVLASQPDNETALLEAGRLLVLAGSQDDAQRLFERLTAVAPSNVDGHLDLLQLLLTKGDTPRAIAEGKAAAAIDDKRSDSHYYLGLAYESARDWHNASGEYAAATQRDPQNFQAFISLCKSLFKEDRYQESIATAGAALALRSDSPEPYRWKTQSQLALGQTEDATTTLESLLNLAGSDPDALAIAARVSSARGDVPKALDYARQASTIDPSNPAGQQALGDVELAAKRPSDALAAYSSTAEMGDAQSQALALTGEGRAYSLLGDNQKAAQLLIAASQEDPSAAEPYFYLGGLYVSANRWDDALQAYHRAVELRPNWPIALYYLGEAYLQRKDLQNAQAAFAKAVNYDPNMVQAWFGLGISERDRGQSSEAIQALSKATQLNATYSEAWLYLGLTYEETGQRAQAANAFTQATDNATDPDVRSQAEQGLARVR
jgi:tetratricopeptide (TPR) repeat protein